MLWQLFPNLFVLKGAFTLLAHEERDEMEAQFLPCWLKILKIILVHMATSEQNAFPSSASLPLPLSKSLVFRQFMNKIIKSNA